MAKRGRKSIDAYEMYQKKYKAAEERQHERGYAMAEPMMSRETFELVYAKDKADYLKNGKTFNKSNVIKNIAEGQRYDVSRNEADRIYRRLKAMGLAKDFVIAGYEYNQIVMSYMSRSYVYQVWKQAIQEYYREGLADGKTSTKLAHDIGVEFYGSPD